MGRPAAKRASKRRPASGLLETDRLWRIVWMMRNAYDVRSRNPNDRAATVPGLSAADLAELGDQLLAVRDGRLSAEEALGIPKRSRGRPRGRQVDLLLIEYYMRAVQEPTKLTEIARDVAQRFGKDVATVQRLARTHRDYFLLELDKAVDVSKLRAHLTLKSKGGNKPK